MPFYKVRVRQDAWIDHESYVEAESAEHAAELGLTSLERRLPACRSSQANRRKRRVLRSDL